MRIQTIHEQTVLNRAHRPVPHLRIMSLRLGNRWFGGVLPFADALRILFFYIVATVVAVGLGRDRAHFDLPILIGSKWKDFVGKMVKHNLMN